MGTEGRGEDAWREEWGTPQPIFDPATAERVTESSSPRWGVFFGLMLMVAAVSLVVVYTVRSFEWPQDDTTPAQAQEQSAGAANGTNTDSAPPAAAALSACEQVEAATAGYSQEPRSTGRPLHPAATDSGWSTDMDWRLMELLVDPEANGDALDTLESHNNLERHASRQSNPDAAALARRHGFVREVFREWEESDALWIWHSITQFSSAQDAQSFLVAVSAYSCQFATDIWTLDLAGSDVPGVGAVILYANGMIAEQVSWTSGARRHVVAVFGEPQSADRALVERLAASAAARDAGHDLLGDW